MNQVIFNKYDTHKLKEVVNHINSEKIFLVRANKSFLTSNAKTFINKLVDNQNHTSFFEFDPNPQIEDLKRGISLFKKGNFELIIAIGGGSVIDMAKLISVFAHQNQNIDDIVLGKVQINNNKTPLIAIPTTAGTGAEATHFAVLYMDKSKYSVAHPTILPDYVYLSSEFSLSANSYLTACTGLDAFCQAIESVWSVNSNIKSEEYALKAIEIIWNNLQKAVKNNNEQAKKQMLEASFLAGKAINITKTTAPHAISYAFTSYYNIPHGHAVALSLPYFLHYNYNVSNIDCSDQRGANKVKERIDKVLNILKIEINDVQTVFVKFFDSLGININISTLVKNFDKNIIINNINTERLSNNPRIVTKETIENMLK